ncbi:hypothetical protein ACOQFV_24310 [Nocardiopsis changdeensis]|uniref:MarR family transcriptional regulator n=1 Tax=Nocardiopsis changdeensis TaxID=2831969 RepID=A0A975QCC2_9ACTN|nr:MULTISPECIES: hypothetical protein [Nocardiopsis]QUX26483.1 hypothetical protein KGD84_32820 [Nocardiopsis changdeensis]QYX40755.1 hypothetical protein K1J57_32670 [Nocardiopsis sp. MT53]
MKRHASVTAPLWVGSRPIGISTATPVMAVPETRLPGGLDDAALCVLYALRGLGRVATTVELAARTAEPVVAVAVALHRLRERDLIRVLRPGWLPDRLAVWTGADAVAPVCVDLVVLVGADPGQPLTRALGQITDTGPLPVQTHLPGSMWVGVSPTSARHQVVVVAVAGLHPADARWSELASAAAAAVIVGNPTAPTPGELPGALSATGIPVVAMTAPLEGPDPAPDVVRATWGLPANTPVVVGDPSLAPDLYTAINHLGKRP